jgi:hypothetical protein
MSEGPKPRRRWVSYSLRSFFSALTALCLWLGWNVNVVQQRYRLREQSRTAWERGERPKCQFVNPDLPPLLPFQATASQERTFIFQSMENRRQVYWKKLADPPVGAKGLLWLRRWLGDEDADLILVFDKADYDQVRSLFPEAYVCLQ